jgi:hypothetical protein
MFALSCFFLYTIPGIAMWFYYWWKKELGAKDFFIATLGWPIALVMMFVEWVKEHGIHIFDKLDSFRDRHVK